MALIKFRNISKIYVFGFLLSFQILSTLSQSHYDGVNKYRDNLQMNDDKRTDSHYIESGHFTATQKTVPVNSKLASVVPRFTGKRTHRKRFQSQNGPIRRQETTEVEGPEVPLSPIQSSLGGLTGLQGLPPLSLIQFIKLLVALTPFLLPIVFVPLLIFTIGMFMIPVTKSKIFIGGDAGIRENSDSEISDSWTSWGYSLVPTLNEFARRVANHEECLDRLVCEIGKKYLPEQGMTSGKETKDSKFNVFLNRPTLQRVLNYFNHPLSHRISRSLQIPPNTCGNLTCRPASFIQKFVTQNK